MQYIASINLPARFYYSQVVRVDRVRKDESGQVWYRLSEKYGSGDIFWGQAEAFRPLTSDEMSPINPDALDKRIIVKIGEQTLSCLEGDQEVHFTRISSGALYGAWGKRVDAWETPIGESPIWRKAVSLPLSGGSASAGWSLPAVGWVSLFSWGQGLPSTPPTGTTITTSHPRAVASTPDRKTRNGFFAGAYLRSHMIQGMLRWNDQGEQK